RRRHGPPGTLPGQRRLREDACRRADAIRQCCGADVRRLSGGRPYPPEGPIRRQAARGCAVPAACECGQRGPGGRWRQDARRTPQGQTAQSKVTRNPRNEVAFGRRPERRRHRLASTMKSWRLFWTLALAITLANGIALFHVDPRTARGTEWLIVFAIECALPFLVLAFT